MKPGVLTYLGRSLCLALALTTCGDDDDDGPNDDPTAGFECPPSTAKSGDLCQVNFNCPAGEGPAAYCTTDGSCDCGPAAENPKKVTLVGICEKELNDAARAVTEACGFGQ
jgi:hypothetical protein